MGSQAKKYYWLKLKKEFFTSRAMKKLRKIAGGDTYTIIYLKLQLLSLEDEGFLYFEGIENDIYEEMALVLDEDVENVKVTMTFLESTGLLEKKSDNVFFLTEVPFLIGGESESAERVRRYRDKKALHCNAPVTECNALVTNCNTEIEIDIEKDIDIEKEKDIDINLSKEKVKKERFPCQQIADMYNNTCVSFPRLVSLSDARKKAIKARLNTYSLENFQTLFEKAEASDFLKGKNDRNWSATFDWLIKDANMAKVLDGNYDNKDNKKDKWEDWISEHNGI